MWYMTELSQTGSYHKKKNGVCQDAVSVSRSVSEEDSGTSAGNRCRETYVIALADGAGSAMRSETGARIAVEYVSSHLASGFEKIYREKNAEKVSRKLIKGLRARLREQSGRDGMPLKAYASTLLAVAVREDRYIIIHLGDGVIGYLQEGRLSVASAPDNGDFANITCFTTSKCAYRAVRLFKGELKGIQGFLLMSDGAETSLYSRRGNILAPGLLEAMRVSAILGDKMAEKVIGEWFLDSVVSQTADDCSLVMMVSNCAFPLYEEVNAGERHRLFGTGAFRKYEKQLIAGMDSVLRELCGRGGKGITQKELKKTQKMREVDLKKVLQMLLSLHFVYMENSRIYSGMRELTG